MPALVDGNVRSAGASVAQTKYICGGIRNYVRLIPHDFRHSATETARRPTCRSRSLWRWADGKRLRCLSDRYETGRVRIASVVFILLRYAIVSSADRRAAIEMILLKCAVEHLSPSTSSPNIDRLTDGELERVM